MVSTVQVLHSEVYKASLYEGVEHLEFYYLTLK